MGQEVKNLLKAQSKYGLMGSSDKNREIFLSEGHRSEKDAHFWVQNIKVPFGIGHPPPTHHMQSTCVWEGSQVPNLQTEFIYFDSFKSYCNSFDLGFLGSGGWDRWVGGVQDDQQ